MQRGGACSTMDLSMRRRRFSPSRDPPPSIRERPRTSSASGPTRCSLSSSSACSAAHYLEAGRIAHGGGTGGAVCRRTQQGANDSRRGWRSIGMVHGCGCFLR
eukprot:2348940-Prymnesium_polylepis.1